ncbi:MAG: T9SS type A sorting domain-containing protein, partial [Chitinophagaceae bacterium]|nr:T9SS type A sorting domain-containing protein [Chitinophagaceae bacterium]
DSIFYDETSPLWFFSGNTYSDYDTLHVCDSGLYPIAIAATGPIDWQWESNPLLDTNFGPSNVFLAKGMQLFKAWRPDILACSGYDTLHIYIKTDSFKAPIFNTGKTLFTTGVYKSYQWFRNEIPLPGATDSFYNAIDTGTYKILVEGESGCSFFTDTIKIYPALNTDYFKIEKGEIFAYPTPASEKLMFHVAFDVNVRIVNLNGIEVLRKNACREMDLSGIANGVYFVVIFDVSGQYLGKQKIIKAG